MNFNYVVMVILLSIAGYLGGSISNNNAEIYSRTLAEKKAITFLIYSTSLDLYLSQNPNSQGDALDKILLPNWLGKDKDVYAYADYGKGYIYTQNTAGLMSSLMSRTDNSTKLGVSNQSQIITNAGAVPKPAYIPNNFLVYIR